MKKTNVKIASLVEVTELKNYYSEYSISDLIETIQTDGLKVPIIISPKNEIIDGYRRVRALKDLGIEDVAVFIDDVKPDVFEHMIRNMHRKKSASDEVKDLRTVFKRYTKRQGKRNDGTPYSRHEQISNATNNQWKDVETINKLEYVLKNDLENDFLSKAIVEKKADVQNCHEFLKETRKIDQENKYGYTEQLIKGEISVLNANTFIKERYFLDKKYSSTFSIPDRCDMYLQDCRKVERLIHYNGQVDVLVTSIPYFQLENYEVDGENQIGHEETKEKYAENIANVFNKQIPLLKDTANVFINVGETYQNGLGLGIPFLIQEYISKHTPLKYKGTIYWTKKNPKPQGESARRPTNTIEHVHWFVLDPKKAKYQHLTYLENEGWRYEISKGAKDVDKNGKRTKKGKSLKKPYKKMMNHMYEQDVEQIVKTSIGANHDILKIKSEGHPCPISPLLVLSLILMTTERDDSSLIYDCFSGSSICGQVATLLNKRYLGVELNKSYHDIGCEILVQANKTLDHESLKELNDFVYQPIEAKELPLAA